MVNPNNPRYGRKDTGNLGDSRRVGRQGLLQQFGTGLCARTIQLAGTLLASGSVCSQPGIAEQAVLESLARIEQYDKRYKAVIALEERAIDRARAVDRQRAARGPLYGEPVLLKDNIESQGMATTAGSLALAANIAAKDAPLVAGLRGADAVILGKANLSEWANFRSEHSSSGWSGVGGQTRNAVEPQRSPCGSSSGSAVAVALGYVDITIGTETSGSIVCPASVNGVVGLKPTHGVVSGAGIVPLAHTQDTAGPITHTVAQAATTLAVMMDRSTAERQALADSLLALNAVQSLKGLRVGIYAKTQNFDSRRDLELASVAATLRTAGAEVVEGLSFKTYPDYGKDSYAVLLYEFSRDLPNYFSGLATDLRAYDLTALTRFNAENASRELRRFDQSIFLKALALADSEQDYNRKRAATRKAMRNDGLDKLFTEHRLDFLMGTTTGPAWKIDWTNGDAFYGPSMAGPAAVAGNPHITLPLTEIDGLPMGISLIGKRMQDDRLVAFAELLVKAHGAIDWRRRIEEARARQVSGGG